MTTSLDRRREIAGHLRSILRDRLQLVGPEEGLSEKTGLLGNGVGLDSVEMLRVVTELEEEFGIIVEDEELEGRHFETFGALVSLVEGKLGGRP